MRKQLNNTLLLSAVGALTMAALPAMARDYDHDRFDHHAEYHGEHRDRDDINIGRLVGAIGHTLAVSEHYDRERYRYYHHPMRPYPVYGYSTVYNNIYVPGAMIPPPPMVAVPTATYTNEYGNYCREFTQQVRIGDRIQESYGTACLQPDGTWRVQ